ncbi:MAG: cation diffusion facilitator family transporter [Alphaproteobacteria bacterium]|nr:cation diffusion facilitator family transporter [Alphaproteobacteria bacterium]
MTNHASVAGRLDPRAAARITRETALLSVGVALVLIAAKAWAWSVSDSISMLASLADSGLDLVASVFTLWAVTYAATPPDADHGYGHGKAESFSALLQALLVGASAALIGVEAVDKMRAPVPVESGAVAIGVMLGSIALTGALIWFQTRAVRRTGSIATAGDRAHYSADLVSNIGVIIAIASSAFLGLNYADPVIGFLLALWLAWGALGVARSAINQLMDRELPDAARARIKALAEGGEYTLAIHRLRTRAAGPIIHIQFHLDVPADISIGAAHDLMVACENRILAEFPGADVLIHPDPSGVTEKHGAKFFSGARGRGS